MNIIGFIHSKGGVGKTTLSMMTALSLVESGHSVIVCDADPQGSATSWARRAADTDRLPFAVVQTPSGKAIREAIDGAQVEYCIIDSPPGYSEILSAIADVIDLALIPTAANPMDIDRVWPTVDFLRNVPTAVVLNSIDGRETASRVVRPVLENEGVHVAETIIPHRAKTKQVFGTRPDVPEHFRELAAEIMEAVQ